MVVRLFLSKKEYFEFEKKPFGKKKLFKPKTQKKSQKKSSPEICEKMRKKYAY